VNDLLWAHYALLASIAGLSALFVWTAWKERN
jgi:hypothetical protein